MREWEKGGRERAREEGMKSERWKETEWEQASERERAREGGERVS